MADRTVKYVLGANVTGFVSGMKAAKGAVGDLAKSTDRWVQKNDQGIRELSTTVGLFGAAAVAGAGLAVKTFADFDKTMSGVEATGEATTAQLGKLREAAIQAGADTAFSATEAAAGVENLLKAGVAAEDVLGGGLVGALDLAAAGELGVADAAEIAATAMTQFKLGGEDVTHIADLLAAGAGKAQGDVTDLAQALAQGGLIASQTGLTIEETTGTLSAFASAGLLGSDAGTSFKTMLQRLSAPTKENAAYMAELGISAYDAAGEFVGMEALAGQLTDALGEMTPAQRNAALATIFGADAVRAAAVVYEQGESGIRDWISAVDDQGYAAEVAATRLDNLHGDLEALGGSLETLLINSGGAGNDGLRSLAQGATDVVNALNSVDEGVLNTATLLVGGGGLVALGVAGMGKLAVGVSDVKAALGGLGVSMRTATISAGALGVALGGAALAFSIWAENAAKAQANVEGFKATLDEFGGTTSDTLKTLNERLTESQGTWTKWGEDQRGLDQQAKDLGASIEDLQQAVLGSDEDFLALGDAMGVTDDNMESIGNGFRRFADENANVLVKVKDLRDQLAQSTTEKERSAAADEALGVAAEDAAPPIQDLTNALEQQAEASDDAFQSMLDYASGALDARGAARNFEAAIDDARKTIEDNGESLDINTKKGRENQAALDNIATAGLGVVEAMREQGATEEELRGSMKRTRKSFVDAAEAAGMERSEAKALADQLGLIPKNVTSQVAVTGIDSSLSRLGTLDATLNNINGKTVTAAVAIKQYGQAGVWTGGRLPGFPTGGRLPGTPPADPTKDNLLGVDERGMPRVRVRSREWVVNEGASDYYGDDVMSAINSRRIPREELAGLPGLAAGGAVRSANRALRQAERRRDAQRERVRNTRQRLREAEREQRRAEKREDDAAAKAAEQRVKRVSKALEMREGKLDDRRQAVQDQRARRDRLREERRDLRVDVRRGDIVDQASGSLSGAYSVADQMRDLARSGDLTKGQSRRLMNAARAEGDMRKLYAQAERLESKLAGARDRVSELGQIASRASSTLQGGFSLGDALDVKQKQHTNARGEVWYSEQGPTGKSLLSAATAYTSKVKKFALTMRKLQKAGFSGVIMQDVAGLGVEQGQVAADALLELSRSDVTELNRQTRGLEVWSDRAGQVVSEGFYKGGLSAAEGLVKGLESQQSAIESQITKVAKGMERALKKALGINSPSKVTEGIAMDTGAGMILGLKKSMPGVSKAAAEMVSLPSAVAPSVYANPSGAGKQNVSVSLDRGAMASAMDGVGLTLLVDGQPVRAVVRTELGAQTAAQDQQSRYVTGVR